MTIRPIIHLWDAEEINQRNSDVLRNPSIKVTFPLDKETHQEIDDLIDTFLSDQYSVGLAAPQINVPKQIFVFDPKYPANNKKTRESILVVINPKIVPSSDDLALEYKINENKIYWDPEGCMSLPDISTAVPRFKSVKLKGFDVKGKPFSKRYEGFPAKIVQHEVDHLLGRMIIDYDQEIYAEMSKIPILKKLLEKLRGT